MAAYYSRRVLCVLGLQPYEPFGSNKQQGERASRVGNPPIGFLAKRAIRKIKPNFGGDVGSFFNLFVLSL